MIFVRAGVVGALVVAGLGSGVAFADDAAQSDGLEIQAPYEQTVVVAPGDGGAAQYRSMALGLQHYSSDFTVTDGRLTVDASGLAGVAEIAWPDNCVPDDAGTVAVCDTGDVPIRYSPQVQLKVRAVAGAAVGAQGAIEYSATATGGPDGTLTAPEYSAETFVTVGSGPDLGVSAPQDVTGVAPGTDLTVPFSVTNTGNETAHGFSVKLWATYGLDVTTRYPQCTYTGPDDTDAQYPAMTYVTCSFDTDVAPGATVELPEPLRLAVTDHALYERFDYEVEPGGDVTDLDTSDNGRAWHIDADNTADFAVHGTEVSGAQGDTVDRRFPLRQPRPGLGRRRRLGRPGPGDRLLPPAGHHRHVRARHLPDRPGLRRRPGRPPLRVHPADLDQARPEGRLPVPAARRPGRPRRQGPGRRPSLRRQCVLHLRPEHQEQLGEGGRQPVRLTAARGAGARPAPLIPVRCPSPP
jgi:hypothetical protein